MPRISTFSAPLRTGEPTIVISFCGDDGAIMNDHVMMIDPSEARDLGLLLIDLADDAERGVFSVGGETDG